jgi:hypothetical protein
MPQYTLTFKRSVYETRTVTLHAPDEHIAALMRARYIADFDELPIERHVDEPWLIAEIVETPPPAARF